MNSHMWVIGVTLSLPATLFGTLGKVLLKLSHTSSQTLLVKAAATVCVVMLNPFMWLIFSFERKNGWRDLDLAPYQASLVIIVTFIGPALNLFTSLCQASVALVAEGGSIWYRPETYVIFVEALSSAGGGIYVLDLVLREHDALYLVSIYQAFLILIGSVWGVIFFDEISGMNTRWQLASLLRWEALLSCQRSTLNTVIQGILSARIIGAKQGEISPLNISQNDRVKHGVKRGFVDIV
ncbi:hypothetical protein PsorP6_013116 [Peronosclerospora sorghi]|uniref:Uncharacterized protein n=1 Tax=Peronosclerospora sorghi TaxID=230839 RepID=A0ACC0WGW7_9STRA|nr:hypothetical protein PsorP6_013116 [Peronosclerospora sorghi]